MEFGFTDEQELLRKTVRKVMERECPREYIRQCSDTEEFPLALYREMVNQGWTGLPFPKKYGGHGGSAIDLAILLEELAYVWVGASTAYFTSVVLGGMNLMNYGTEEQKAQLLPALIRGDVRFALALSEPGVGSDAAAVETHAAVDGDELVINGRKTFITNAHAAEYLLVVTRTKRDAARKQDGITTILVNTNSPGLEIRPLKQLGRNACHTNDVIFTNVRVPRANALGKLHQSWAGLVAGLGIERMSIAIVSAGNAQRIIDYVLDYARNRVQFGRPISRFQALQHKFADMQAKVAAARLLAYHTAWLLVQARAGAKDMSIAKLFATETLVEVANHGMQIMGGYGYMNEYDMQLFFRDARIATIGGGTSEIQRNIIARAMGC